MQHGNQFKDRTGDIHGRLTVIREASPRTDSSGRVHVRWECRCECGRIHIVKSKDFRTIKSCGCFHPNRRHGRTGTVEYTTWAAMKRRCYRKDLPEYPYYGGRGIKVCDRWVNSFENFFTDMGVRPSKTHSIERLNNDGDYSPENCVWAKRKTQARNKRSNRLLTARGRTQPMFAWAEEVGISGKLLHARLNALKWDVEKAIFTPVKK